MIATMDSPCFVPSLDDLHSQFLSLAPRIELHARIFFRHIKCPHKRADAVAETLALAWKWFVRLVQRGKDVSTFVTAFASLAARAVNSGRRLCGQERANDVTSPSAQRRHDFKVEALPSSTARSHENLYDVVHGQQMQDTFEERLQDNTITPVPDQVAFRIDFPAWLNTLTARERRIIRDMAQNERTRDLSRRFELSPGRISQLRREFEQGWKRYCSDADAEAGVAMA